MSSPSLAARGVARRRPHCRRSRNGCLTCKKRKVRCDEQGPQCYHCQRLNLECVWKSNVPQRVSPPSKTLEDVGDRRSETGSAALDVGWPSPQVDLFGFLPSVADPTQDFGLFQDIYLPDLGDLPAPVNGTHDRVRAADLDAASTRGSGSPREPPRQPPAESPIGDPDVEESMLLQAPPILDPVENGPMGASLRALFDNMASSSPMVRCAIAAFAAVQLYSTGKRVDYQPYYDKAANELSARFHKSGTSISVDSTELRYVLTTMFFLIYINFLTGRLDLANSNLAKAHMVLKTSGRASLGSIEQRIVSWIRLSDARAALAGGEGLLITDTSGIYPSSPSSTALSPEPQGSICEENSSPHEVIYNILCQPGIAFFQEVQTITGRITRIAHFHRSRGTVKDETEVMAIAADILKDLAILYDRRPTIMDHAVAGHINGDTLAEPLASGIVRSFRTYLANFYVCYIHLHRVAHRHLARSDEVDTAVSKIKEIMHLMVDNNVSVPVNMLWPLFLWGSEEEDEEECLWILKTIRSLQNVATNANMTADVLQETQRRQRAAGARVDIRSVCLELFNATFAII